MRLNGKVLILNRSWLAVAVAETPQAIGMLFAGRARVVCPQSYEVFAWDEWVRRPVNGGQRAVRGVSVRFAAPDVLLLAAFDGAPFTGPAFSRRAVQRRDRFTCQYCGARPPLAELTIDHVVPRSHGGDTSWENCVSACRVCNRQKGDHTPAEAGLLLRARPRRPRWMLPGLGSQAQMNESWARFLAPIGVGA